MFSQNKTSEWLNKKTPVEKERLLQASRKLTKIHRQNFKKRKEEIEARRFELLKQKQKELSEKREKDLKEKEELTLKIQKYGLWTTSTEVEQQLSVIKTEKAKMETLIKSSPFFQTKSS